MRPTPIPDEDVWEGARRLVVGPPDNDPTGEIRPVEALVDVVGNRPRFAIRYVLEEGDLEKLSAGEPFWLLFYGDHIHPFMLAMDDEREKD